MKTILSIRNRAKFIQDEKGNWTMVKAGITTPVTVSLSENQKTIIAYQVLK